MTAEKLFVYLNRESIRTIHDLLSRWAKDQGEPIPSFGFAKDGDLEALIAAPQHRFFGMDAYPSVAEKAAIIFYTVNKRQIFVNGNKRMSTLCMLVFLAINGKGLSASSDQLTQKALWLANTASDDFPNIKKDLVDWITGHLIDVPMQEQ